MRSNGESQRTAANPRAPGARKAKPLRGVQIVPVATTGEVQARASSNSEKANEARAQLQARMGFREGRVTGITTRFSDLLEEFPDAPKIERKRATTRGGNALGGNDNTIGTIYDRRMGPLNGYQECMTCHQGMDSCPTHPGLIRLPKEAYFINPLAIKYAYQVLQSVCNSCGKLLITRETLRLDGIDHIRDQDHRLQLISDRCSGMICTRSSESAAEAQAQMGRKAALSPCKANNIFVTTMRDYGQIVYAINKDAAKPKQPKESKKDDKGKKKKLVKDQHIMDISRVENIFNSIDAKDLEALGFTGLSHPRNYVQKAIMVLPPRSRLNQNNDGKVRDDPIGKLYERIIDRVDAINTKRSELERAKAHVLNGLEAQNGRAWETLNPKERREWADKIDATKEVSNLRIGITDEAGKIRDFYSQIIFGPSTPATNQWVHKGIKADLQNKEGHVRGSMMAKRVGNMGRTVGSAGPEIRIMEVGIPYKFREELTVPETAFEGNIEHLRKLVLDGECVRIDLHRRGIEITIKVSETNILSVANKIRLGDVVHRRLDNGDYLMLNRQPTIHKQSIFVVRARLTPLDTIQVSLPQVDALKGDFDGDEYNIHVIQSIEARALSIVLQSSYACLANEQNNSTMMTPTFEAPLAGLNLTTRTTLLPEDTWNLFASYISPRFDEEDLSVRLAYKDPARGYEEVPRYSGAALISAMLPHDFNYRKRDRDDKENVVDINMGVMRSGHLNKSMLSSGSGLTNAIRLRYGDARAAHFIDSAQFVLQYYGLVMPTSLGIDDCYYDIESVRELKKSKIHEAEIVQNSSDYARQSAIEREIEEREMITMTDNIKAEGSKMMMQNIPEDNAFIHIAMSGAKGNRNNVYQILVSAGQQFYRGERMPLDYSYGTRSLPAFIEGDTRLTARGLCINSFSVGLTPQELFFLQKAGRKNLTDTSQTTFIPGMIRREFTNMLSDLSIAHDGSVRTSAGEIVQLSYNGDGLSSAKLHKRNFLGFSTPYFTNTNEVVLSLNREHEYANKTK